MGLFGNKSKAKHDSHSCEVRGEGEYRVVVLTGEVDLSWSAEIRKAILGELAARKPVLVDLARVTYIDSSGIASFVEGYQQARGQKTQFGLLGVTGPVMSSLKLARLDRVFPLYADIPAARGAASKA